MTTSLTVSPPQSLTARADIYNLIDEWLELLNRQVNAGELAAASRDTYTVGIRRFVDWAEGNRTVTDNLILDWKAALLAEGRKPNTVSTWLSGVRAFFAWAASTHRIPHNPAAEVRGARRKGTNRKHLREALTSAEVQRILSQPDTTTDAGKRDSAILHLMAYTAARTIELHRADLEHLRTQSGKLTLGVHGKGRDEADEIIVITHPDAQNAVHDWLAERGSQPGPIFISLSPRTQGQRLSLRSIRELIKGYFRSAGVHGDRKTAHSLRHSAISSAVRRGAPIHKVQAMARHANISTTMIYVHETDRIENPAEEYIDYKE